MKRSLEKVAPEDYAHYTQQLKLQLGMFENLAPNGSMADKQRALDHAHCMVVQASLAATAFSRYVRGTQYRDGTE